MEALDVFRSELEQIYDTADTEIGEGAIDIAIASAVEFYSKRINPRDRVEDYDGDGDTHSFPVPDDWVEDGSRIKRIEYPADRQEPSIYDPKQYTLYLDGEDWKIRTYWTPASGSIMRVFYTTLHTLSESTNTIPGSDQKAVLNLAAFYIGQYLSTKYASTIDTAMDLDVISFQQKSGQYRRVAEHFRMMFNMHFGMKADDLAPAVMEFGDLDLPSSGEGSLGTGTVIHRG